MRNLIKKILKESDWDVFDLSSSKVVWDPETLKAYLKKYGSLDGRHGETDEGEEVWEFTVKINGGSRKCKQVWPNKTNEVIVLWEAKYNIPDPPYYRYGEMCATYTFKEVCEFFNDGTWVVDQDVLNESKDFDWVDDIEPTILDVLNDAFSGTQYDVIETNREEGLEFGYLGFEVGTEDFDAEDKVLRVRSNSRVIATFETPNIYYYRKTDNPLSSVKNLTEVLKYFIKHMKFKSEMMSDLVPNSEISKELNEAIDLLKQYIDGLG